MTIKDDIATLMVSAAAHTLTDVAMNGHNRDEIFTRHSDMCSKNKCRLRNRSCLGWNKNQATNLGDAGAADICKYAYIVAVACGWADMEITAKIKEE